MEALSVQVLEGARPQQQHCWAPSCSSQWAHKCSPLPETVCATSPVMLMGFFENLNRISSVSRKPRATITHANHKRSVPRQSCAPGDKRAWSKQAGHPEELAWQGHWQGGVGCSLLQVLSSHILRGAPSPAPSAPSGCEPYPLGYKIGDEGYILPVATPQVVVQ